MDNMNFSRPLLVVLALHRMNPILYVRMLLKKKTVANAILYSIHICIHTRWSHISAIIQFGCSSKHCMKNHNSRINATIIPNAKQKSTFTVKFMLFSTANNGIQKLNCVHTLSKWNSIQKCKQSRASFMQYFVYSTIAARATFHILPIYLIIVSRMMWAVSYQSARLLRAEWTTDAWMYWKTQHFLCTAQ